MRALAPVVAGVVAAGTAFGVVAASDGDDRGSAPPTVDASVDGRSVFARMGCGNCHRFAAAEVTGRIGPSLDAALDGYDATTLAEQIVRPRRRGGMSIMPRDYGRRMNAEELSALVAYLLENRPR